MSTFNIICLVVAVGWVISIVFGIICLSSKKLRNNDHVLSFGLISIQIWSAILGLVIDIGIVMLVLKWLL